MAERPRHCRCRQVSNRYLQVADRRQGAGVAEDSRDGSGSGAYLAWRMGTHDGDAKPRRTVRDGRIAYRRYEEPALFKFRARRKRPFLVAYDYGHDCRLAANGDSVTRKFRDKKRDILDRLPFPVLDETEG